MDAYLHIKDMLSRLVLDPKLRLLPYIYIYHLVCEFYANSKQSDKHSGSYLATIIRGHQIELSHRRLAKILESPDEGKDIVYRGKF